MPLLLTSGTGSGDRSPSRTGNSGSGSSTPSPQRSNSPHSRDSFDRDTVGGLRSRKGASVAAGEVSDEVVMMPEEPGELVGMDVGKDDATGKMSTEELVAEAYGARRKWCVGVTVAVVVALFVAVLAMAVTPWVRVKVPAAVGEGFRMESYSLWTTRLDRGGASGLFVVSPSCTVMACSKASVDAGTCQPSGVPIISAECGAYNASRALLMIGLVLMAANAGLLANALLSPKSFVQQSIGGSMFRISAIVMSSAAASSFAALAVFLGRLLFAVGVPDVVALATGFTPVALGTVAAAGAAAVAVLGWQNQREYEADSFYGTEPPPDRTCPEVGFV